MSTRCICQGFIHFSVVLHHFVMAKLATGSIRDIIILEEF